MIEIQQLGAVTALHMGKPIFGLLPPLMTVRCFAVDGLLFDAGLVSHGAEVAEFARAQAARRCLLTHHHEDHSGGAGAVAAAGIEVHASPLTAAHLSSGWRLYPYQHLLWGRPSPVAVRELPSYVESDRYRFDVIPAPGHSDDLVVFHEVNQGWLFSGDAFIAERVRYFRGDEDFRATIESLQRLVALEFDTIYCAHNPQLSGGKQALRNKLDHLLEIEGQVRRRYAAGRSMRAIAREVLGREQPSQWLITGADFTKLNLVRSILRGPTKRKPLRASPTGNRRAG